MSALVAESDLTAFPVCVTPTLIIRSTFQRILYQNTIFAPIRPLLSLRRPHELDLEAAAVGGLAVAAAGIVEVEDDFTGETDCRFAHVLRLEPLRGFDHNLLGRGGHDLAVVHHRLDRIVHLERDLAVGAVFFLRRNFSQ